MPRVRTLLRNGRKAIQDSDLLKVLQSEISHELSSTRFFQNEENGSFGDFALEWDSAQTQDVVLRKKYESGEEVAVSALLGPKTHERESSFPWTALMKVCIKKPGLSSMLQFDCGVFSRGAGSDFGIQNAYYIQSPACLDASAYRGPLYSSLDPDLQDQLKQYLAARGIEESFTNFLLLHLHKKEQEQYVNWLRKLEAMVAEEN